MKKILIFTSLFLILITSMAQASTQCNKREKMLGLLQQKYQEEPTAIGVANNGGLVEVLTSKDGKTWSIIVTSPNGMSCLVSAGTDWDQKRFELPGEAI